LLIYTILLTASCEIFNISN